MRFLKAFFKLIIQVVCLNILNKLYLSRIFKIYRLNVLLNYVTGTFLFFDING